jgi:hypothetical protein
MTSFLKKILFLSFIIFCTTGINAQKIEIGGGLGAMNYKGDISPDFHPSFARLGGNILLRYNLKKDVTFRASALIGSIYGDDTQVSDPFNQLRGLTFNTSITEFNLVTEYNFFNYQYNRYQKDWTPYVFGGLGFMHFSPQGTPMGDYKKNQLVIPFGIGIKYNINGPWDLNIEFGTRKTFTDFLDNLGEDTPNAPINLQSDYTRNDMYYYTSLALTYKFIKVHCPK